MKQFNGYVLLPWWLFAAMLLFIVVALTALLAGCLPSNPGLMPVPSRTAPAPPDRPTDTPIPPLPTESNTPEAPTPDPSPTQITATPSQEATPLPGVLPPCDAPREVLGEQVCFPVGFRLPSAEHNEDGTTTGVIFDPGEYVSINMDRSVGGKCVLQNSGRWVFCSQLIDYSLYEEWKVN